MKIHEFGDRANPVILLLPGTACYWKANFGKVIDELAEDFLVGVVSYTGFDPEDAEDFSTIMHEVEEIEHYVNDHYNGRICCAYGCSLGGSLVGLLISRHNMYMHYGILGSSDLDQKSALAANVETAIIGKVIYPFIHNGYYPNAFLQKRFEKKMTDKDPYNQAFVGMVGADKYDMSFISKTSLKNQFYSDLVTPLPEGIHVEGTEVHIFYALKMGEKYRHRYLNHFQHPVIHEHDLRHEELLILYPHEWCRLVTKICQEDL